MAKNKVELILTGDAKGATRAFRDVDSAAHGLSGKLNTLGSHLGKIAVGFAGLYAIKEAAGFLWDAGKAAVEDAASQQKLATVVQNVTGATTQQVAAMEAWIAKTQMATGISDSDLRPALQNLVVATGSVSAAQGLMGVAMDISVAKGLNLETVTKAMQKAHDGNTGALGKLGIATKDAEGKTLSFEEIVKNAATTFGGSAADAADELAGKAQRIGEMFGEAKESLGAVFLPVLEKLLGWVTANMPAIQAGFEKTFAAIGAAIDWISNAVVPALQTAIQTFRGWFEGDAGPAVNVVWEAIKTVAGVLKDFIVNVVVPGIQGALGAFRTWWSEHGAAVSTVFDAIRDAAGYVISKIVEHWPEIQKTLGTVWGAIKVVLWAFSEVLGAIFDAAAKAVEYIRDHWETIGPIVKKAWEVATGPLGLMVKAFIAIRDAVQWAIDKIHAYNSTNIEAKSAHEGTGGNWIGTSPTGNVHTNRGVFAEGGIVRGLGAVPIIAHGGERVLTSGQTALFERMVAALERGAGGRGLTLNQYITGARAEGEEAANAAYSRLAAMMVTV